MKVYCTNCTRVYTDAPCNLCSACGETLIPVPVTLSNTINLTPHEVNFVPKQEEPITFAASGKVIRLTEMKNPAGGPFYHVTYSGVEGVTPQDLRGYDYAIVSRPVAERHSCVEETTLIVPGDLIRDNQGRVIGCSSFYIF